MCVYICVTVYPCLYVYMCVCVSVCNTYYQYALFEILLHLPINEICLYPLNFLLLPFLLKKVSSLPDLLPIFYNSVLKNLEMGWWAGIKERREVSFGSWLWSFRKTGFLPRALPHWGALWRGASKGAEGALKKYCCESCIGFSLVFFKN